MERYGFAALWVSSKALKPEELKDWRQWRQPDFRSSEGDLWIYLLKPDAHPVLPKLEPTQVCSDSFYPMEKDPRRNLRWRWVWGSARIDFLIPQPSAYRFRFGLGSMAEPRTIRVKLDGKLVSRALAPAQYGVYRQLEVRLELSPRPAAPPVEGGRRLTFEFFNDSLEPLAGP